MTVSELAIGLSEQYKVALFSEAVKALGSLLALGLAAMVGFRVSNYWTTRQKRKEMYLTLRGDFCQAYGRFFSTWKAWNYYLRNTEREASRPTKMQWSLFKEALSSEAVVESILVRLASDRDLGGDAIRALACFRQAYQQLRKIIQKKEKLDWAYCDHPQYVAFKRYACEVIAILDKPVVAAPAPHLAAWQLLAITDNKWESTWDRHSAE